MAKKRKYQWPRIEILAAAERPRHKWPKIKFHGTGKKLTTAEILAYPMDLTDDLFDFLRWRNGGIPELDSFVMDFEGEPKTVARVQYFNGIQTGDDLPDLAVTTLNCRDYMPRGAIPIGEVQIAGEDFDGCTLLTFLWGDRANEIYFFDNPHDCGGIDPDDESHLTLLAKSLPQFVKSLKSHEEFLFREVFLLQCDRKSFPAIEAALEKAGTESFHGDDASGRKRSINRYANWERLNTSVYLSSGAKEIYWVPLPKGLRQMPATSRSMFPNGIERNSFAR